MKNLGETELSDRLRAEGECENSQAKGPDLDDTLESDRTPKKQFFAVILAVEENLSGKHTEAY